MTARTHDAAIALASIIEDGMFAHEVGPSLTCIEAEIIAEVARSVGRNTEADRWLSGHASGDGEGDLHYEAPSPAGAAAAVITRRDG